MEILLFFVFILLIVLLIVVLSNNSSQRSNARELSERMMHLTTEIRHLKQQIQNAPPAQAPPVAPTQPEPIQEPEVPPVVVAPTPIPKQEPTPETEDELIAAALRSAQPEFETKETAQPETRPIEEPLVIVQPTAKAPTYYKPTESFFATFLKKNPDIEKFIGENLINKIGIAILVMGIAFFVKYAIDKDWINEVGRVAIGFGCGALLVGIAHYLRKKYWAFSSVLVGGGISVFYFTVAFAFHQYHIISQTAAFVLMIVITGFAVALSLLYERMELAIIATIGGFITPFLLSTGSGNYKTLFIYLIILNTGLLLLAYFKRWRPINIIALFFTVLIYGAWLGKTLNAVPLLNFEPGIALAFGSAFYVLFLAMNMINQIRNTEPFKAFDFSILLFINAAYFSASMCILHQVQGGDYQGLFTIVMGVINMGLAWYFYKRGGTERNLLFLLIGLTLTFLSLAIPVQLHGHTITLFWSAEFVLLYWLFQKSGIKLFRYSSILVFALSFISLFIDWSQAATSSNSSLTLIYKNLTGFVTNIVSIAALVGYAQLLKNSDADGEFIAGLKNTEAKRVMYVATGLLTYITCIFGVNYLCRTHANYDIANVYHRLITIGFAVAAVMLLKGKASVRSLGLQVAAVITTLFFYLLSNINITKLRNGALNNTYSDIHLVIHFINGLLLLFLFYRLIQFIRNNPETVRPALKPLTWGISLMLLLFLSIEAKQLYITMGYAPGKIELLAKQYGKAGITVVWAVCSFIMMMLGMKHKFKLLRVVSLSIFSLTLLKLFTYDIRNVSEAGKIIAFILLGVLLLVISFMYQKLKKIIFDEKE
ncbi:MAG: DUF2339 domain-containing protein [Sphingobacteriales bacterium]|nr:MAG: DUF2339 domain-containing protein [Sphingobacteriales bacterium]